MHVSRAGAGGWGEPPDLAVSTQRAGRPWVRLLSSCHPTSWSPVAHPKSPCAWDTCPPQGPCPLPVPPLPGTWVAPLASSPCPTTPPPGTGESPGAQVCSATTQTGGCAWRCRCGHSSRAAAPTLLPPPPSSLSPHPPRHVSPEKPPPNSPLGSCAPAPDTHTSPRGSVTDLIHGFRLSHLPGLRPRGNDPAPRPSRGLPPPPAATRQ